jgi:glycerol-3-phosphate dehydrogenase (NAD(P)+)
MKISILGYGTFGQSLGSYLERLNHEIIREDISGDTTLVFIAVPSVNVIEVLLKFNDKLKNKKIIICSKGLSSNGKLLSIAISEDSLLKDLISNIFFLYGPTMADGLRRGDLSGVILSGIGDMEAVKKVIESDNLKIYLSKDVVGTQVGAALKNVISLFLGICEGSSLAGNTQAYIFTKCLEEVSKISFSLGGAEKSIFTLSCMGDITLPSRSKMIGIKLGQGCTLEDILKDTNYTIESLNTLKNIKVLLNENNIEAPILNIIYSIIYEKISINEAIDEIRKSMI